MSPMYDDTQSNTRPQRESTMNANVTESVEHLADEELTRSLHREVMCEKSATARVLVRIAEFDARRLYVPAGYPSMHAYCVGVIKFSDDEAYKRIQVARSARKAPALLVALSEGRLHLTAAVMLSPHLTSENAEELIEHASGRSKFELEAWIQRRFRGPSIAFASAAVAPGSPPVPELAGSAASQLVPEPVAFIGKFANVETRSDAGVPPAAPAGVPAMGTEAPERTPVRYALRATTQAKLDYARQLLGHAVPSGDVDQVLDRALDLLIAKLEKRKFAATTRPRVRKDVESASEAAGAPRSRTRTRSIPAEVKSAVWQRDGGRCTFVAASGHRCEARHRLEYDHIEPFALGGASTVSGMRLRCRAHNQYEAEQRFGAEFMTARREAARRAAADPVPI